MLSYMYHIKTLLRTEFEICDLNIHKILYIFSKAIFPMTRYKALSKDTQTHTHTHTNFPVKVDFVSMSKLRLNF